MDNASSERDRIYAEILATLSHEFGNALMLIQDALDQLYAHHGESEQLQVVRSACSHAASVLHGSLGVVADKPQDKEVFSLAEYLESMLPHLQAITAYPLALKIHDVFNVHASRQGLGNAFALLLQSIEHGEDREMYIEIYPHPDEPAQLGVVTLNVTGSLGEDHSRWRMLQTMLDLQGAKLMQEVHESGVRCHLVMEQHRQQVSPLTRREGVDIHTAAVIDHDPRVAKVVGRYLQALGFTNVELFQRPDDALTWLKLNSPAVILVEYDLPGMSGMDLLQCAKGAIQNSVLALMCGMIPKRLDSMIQFLGLPVQVLVKPFGPGELLGLCQKAQAAQRGNGHTWPPEITDSMKNTIRLERPKRQQCPPGFTADP